MDDEGNAEDEDGEIHSLFVASQMMMKLRWINGNIAIHKFSGK